VGGPSSERGISLNSARSIFDNLDKNKYIINIIYYNLYLDAYLINHSLIYSNTPLDFDYKLKSNKESLSRKALDSIYCESDVVFPVIHGEFGEDGQLQNYLDNLGVHYVGSGAAGCYSTSNKYECQSILKNNSFFTKDNWLLNKGEGLPKLDKGKYVIKPLQGGSSMGIQYIEIPIMDYSILDYKLKDVFSHGDKAIIEPFFTGTEFTLIVLENEMGEPISLIPTEVEFSSSDDKFFDYRKKYLATSETRYHTPARFDMKITKKIREEAEDLFSILKLRDFARFDGWVNGSGDIWFSDINAISGMEQNSFLFQQASILGLSHRQLVDFIITKKVNSSASNCNKKHDIPVLFGGKTAEKQISIMSGTNVWMKLKSSDKYNPIPFFIDTKDNIYSIPAFLCLHHTVEEIEKLIEELFERKSMDFINKITDKILKKLNISRECLDEPIFIPSLTSLELLSKEYDFIFLGLHGGSGEDGTIQSELDTLEVSYNGPGSECSALCMDKYKTGDFISRLNIEGVTTAKKIVASMSDDIPSRISDENINWPIVLKPTADGCSAGVIKVDNIQSLEKALSFLSSNLSYIPSGSIQSGQARIELPSVKVQDILIEEFIESDRVQLDGLNLNWIHVNDYIEVTVGVLGKSNEIVSFNPSQTVASDMILTLEEKFMGGHGINITPPPSNYIDEKVMDIVKYRISLLANSIGIEGYSRIDAFMNITNGDLIIIEINTLPALTPSTVIFHQALTENPAMTPCEFLERLIETKK